MGKFEVDLILEVKKHQCLYNKSSIDFKNRSKKVIIWQHIAKVLGSSTSQCQKKWMNLRDTFSRLYKAQQMSNSRTATPIKWKYYDTIKYLSESSKFQVVFVDCKEEPKEQPAQAEQIIDLEPLHSTVIEKTQETSGKRKRQLTEDTANTIAISNLNDSYVLSPLHQFFNSIASQAETLSRQKQLKLQMKCLKSLEEVELADSD